MLFMRTTIDLPDNLLRQAKARAALDGIALKELVARYVAQGLRKPTPPETTRRLGRSPLPVVRPATNETMPALDNAEVQDILDREDAADAFPR
jgi:hypothetical protein